MNGIKTSSPLTIKCILFVLTEFMLFFAIDGSFNIQSIAIVVVIAFLWDVVHGFQCLKINKTHLVLLALCVVYLLSLAVNVFLNPSIISNMSVIRLLYSWVVLYYFISFTAQDYARNEIFLIIDSIIITSVIASCMIIYQFFVGQSGKLTITGFLGVSINPNLIGGLLSIAPLLILFKVMYGKRIITKVVWFLLLGITVFGVFLTGSRAAFLALAMSFVLLYFILLFFSSLSIGKKILVFALSIIAGGVLLSVIFQILPDFIIQRFFYRSYVDDSNIERINIWKFGIQGFLEHPFFGYGAGNYNYYFSQVFSNHADSVVAHNTYLDILIDVGLVGFTLFAVFLYLVFKKCLTKKMILFLPLIVNVFFTTFIVGAERSVYLWNFMILYDIASQYLMKNTEGTFRDFFVRD